MFLPQGIAYTDRIAGADVRLRRFADIRTSMPNIIAYIVLGAWPFVALLVYRRMPIERAFVWTIVAGYLILPPRAEFDLPLLAPLDKFTLVGITAYFLTVTVGQRKVPLLPKNRLLAALLLGYVLSPLGTVLVNPEPVVLYAQVADQTIAPGGVRVLPGLAYNDFIRSATIKLFHVLPLLVARVVLDTAQGRREILRGLTFGALAYLLPTILEAFIGPSFNIWIYGFLQHDLGQLTRGSGYRPIVFLPHALWLSFYLVTAVIAAAALARSEPFGRKKTFIFGVIILMLTIVLAKSWAPLIYATLTVPFVFLFPEKSRARVAGFLVTLALLYPLLRNAAVLPLDAIVEYAESWSADRAQSLGFRFENEELLVEHAREKFLFGWGGWGRHLLYRPEDAVAYTIPDGRWIVDISIFGIAGFVTEFGVLAMSVLMVSYRMRRAPQTTDITGAGTLALIMGVTMFDMLINSPIVPYVWMTAGALVGAAERMKQETTAVSVRAERRPPVAARTILDAPGVVEDEPRTVL